MYRHPSFAEDYIRQREHELARSAALYGPLMAGRNRPRRALRYRVGWRLVEIGLTLASKSAVEVP
ncbi:MAG TPA: hypothetical protein VGS06_45815 [Streptosporangiaceae bacterium]|nr:hypothetical protein [Streptosporangiaceae bacterium]